MRSKLPDIIFNDVIGSVMRGPSSPPGAAALPSSWIPWSTSATPGRPRSRSWREAAGVSRGGIVEVRQLNDGMYSLSLTPRPPRRAVCGGDAAAGRVRAAALGLDGARRLRQPINHDRHSNAYAHALILLPSAPDGVAANRLHRPWPRCGRRSCSVALTLQQDYACNSDQVWHPRAMHGSANSSQPAAPPQGVFTTTHWSVVLAAGQDCSPQSTEALEQLCRTYWYPVYLYVRRRGHSVEDAQDLTQQFFAQLLEKRFFTLADPARGRFRSFLLLALERFLINEWKRAHRLKRGGEGHWMSLNTQEGEQRYAEEPATATLTPDRAYERRWAMTLLEQALAAVRQEYIAAGNARVFEELAELLWGKDVSTSYAQTGERLGLTEGAARGAMHRLRERYRERLRAEVAHTVAHPGEVEDELRYLIAVISQAD